MWRRLIAPSADAVATRVRPRCVVRMYPSSSRETARATAWAVAASSNESVIRAIDFIRIAPGRFELPSRVPKTRMLDRYTTGLPVWICGGV